MAPPAIPNGPSGSRVSASPSDIKRGDRKLLTRIGALQASLLELGFTSSQQSLAIEHDGALHRFHVDAQGFSWQKPDGTLIQIKSTQSQELLSHGPNKQLVDRAIALTKVEKLRQNEIQKGPSESSIRFTQITEQLKKLGARTPETALEVTSRRRLLSRFQRMLYLDSNQNLVLLENGEVTARYSATDFIQSYPKALRAHTLEIWSRVLEPFSKASELYRQLSAHLGRFRGQSSHFGSSTEVPNLFVHDRSIYSFKIERNSSSQISIFRQERYGDRTKVFTLNENGVRLLPGEALTHPNSLDSQEARLVGNLIKSTGDLISDYESRFRRPLSELDQSYRFLLERSPELFRAYAEIFAHTLSAEEEFFKTHAQKGSSDAHKASETTLDGLKKQLATARAQLLTEGKITEAGLTQYENNSRAYQVSFQEYQKDYLESLRKVNPEAQPHLPMVGLEHRSSQHLGKEGPSHFRITHIKNIFANLFSPPYLKLVTPESIKRTAHYKANVPLWFNYIYQKLQELNNGLRRLGWDLRIRVQHFSKFPYEFPIDQNGASILVRPLGIPMAAVLLKEAGVWALSRVPKYFWNLEDHKAKVKTLEYTSSPDGSSMITRLRDGQVHEQYRWSGKSQNPWSVWVLTREIRKGLVIEHGLKPWRPYAFWRMPLFIRTRYMLKDLKKTPAFHEASMRAITRYKQHNESAQLSHAVPSIDIEAETFKFQESRNLRERASHEIARQLSELGIEYILTVKEAAPSLQNMGGLISLKRTEIKATNVLGTCEYVIVEREIRDARGEKQKSIEIQAREGEQIRINVFDEGGNLSPIESGQRRVHEMLKPKSRPAWYKKSASFLGRGLGNMRFGLTTATNSLYLGQFVGAAWTLYDDPQNLYPHKPVMANPLEFIPKAFPSVVVLSSANILGDALINSYQHHRFYNDLYTLKPIGSTLFEGILRRGIPLFTLNAVSEFYQSGKDFSSERFLDMSTKMAVVSTVSASFLRIISSLDFARRWGSRLKLLRIEATSAGPETVGVSFLGGMIFGALEIGALSAWEEHENLEYLRSTEDKLRKSLSIAIIHRNQIQARLRSGEDLFVSEIMAADQALLLHYENYQKFLSLIHRSHIKVTETELPLDDFDPTLIQFSDEEKTRIKQEYRNAYQEMNRKIAEIHGLNYELPSGERLSEFAKRYATSSHEDSDPKTQENNEADPKLVQDITDYLKNQTQQNPSFAKLPIIDQAESILEFFSSSQLTLEEVKNVLETIRKQDFVMTLQGSPGLSMPNPESQYSLEFLEKAQKEELVLERYRSTLLSHSNILEKLSWDPKQLEAQFRTFVDSHNQEVNAVLSLHLP